MIDEDEDVPDLTFRRGAIRPTECIRQGWRLIRDDYWLFFGITVVGMLIGSVVPMGILMGPMMCGMYYCLLRKDDGRRVQFDMLFKGFDHFAQSLVATLVIIIPAFCLIVPAYVAFFVGMISMAPPPGPRGAPPGPPPNLWLFPVMSLAFMAWVMMVSLVIHVLFVFTYPLIVDRKLSGMRAVGLSVKASLGNLGGVFVLLGLTMLMSIAGLFACYVGAFFVLPLSMAANAVAYRDVFPLYDDDEELEELPPEPEPD